MDRTKPVGAILLCALFISFSTFAQNDNPAVGARAAGMGNASATVSDVWSVFNNVGAVSGVEDASVGFAYERRFGGAFNLASAAFVYPHEKLGVGGVSFFRFGDDLYSTNKLGISYGHKIGVIGLGVKANWHQLSIRDLGSKSAVVLEFGGTAQITEELSFGAHIYNFTLSKLADFQDERIPTVLKAGISYRPFEKLSVNIETEKDLEERAAFKGGIEYEIIQDFKLRTGILSEPLTGTFGLGFSPKAFGFDYALVTNEALGLSHHIALSYKFNRK